MANPTTSVDFTNGAISRGQVPASLASFTVCGWYKSAVLGYYPRGSVFGISYLNDEPWIRFGRENNTESTQVYVYRYGSVDSMINFDDVTNGGWQWFALRFDSGSYNWWKYIADTDTMHSGTESVANVPDAWAPFLDLFVGTSSFPSYALFPGLITAFRLWDRKLTDEEIGAEQWSPTAVASSGLIAEPDLTSSTSALTDLSGTQDFTIYSGTLATASDAPPWPDVSIDASGGDTCESAESGTCTSFASCSGGDSVSCADAGTCTHDTIDASCSGGDSIACTETGHCAALSAGGGLTVEQATQLREIYRMLGLDPACPLVVTATSRTAGAGIVQTISESEDGTVTITRQ